MKTIVKTQSLKGMQPSFRFMVEVCKDDDHFKILDTSKFIQHEDTTEYEWVATAFTRGVALHLAKILNEHPYTG